MNTLSFFKLAFSFYCRPVSKKAFLSFKFTSVVRALLLKRKRFFSAQTKRCNLKVFENSYGFGFE